jgi:hypothetical protein
MTWEYYSNLLTRLDKKISELNSICKNKNHLLSEQFTRPQKFIGNGKITGPVL